MSVRERNNVQVTGSGPTTLLFAHGFGCDQSMWRFLAPSFAQGFTVVTFDLVGSGKSDLDAYDYEKYGTLQGYADDILEVIDYVGAENVIYVGHSVSAMTGMLAGIKAPERIAAHVMIAPSPCYVNDADYVGGFTRADIDSLLETMESNYLGWSSNMAPAIMGAAGQPELAVELTNSFCRTDPDIARHFARVTFLSDNRQDVAKLVAPTLIVQCHDDMIAPRSVGEYLARTLPKGTLRLIENVGHCPHLSAPGPCVDSMREFFGTLGV
ncbi:MAG: alpha/beta hydrolase [Pseudomonadota bacterium]|nr:alpha/beta hydrolase [Pseudomonadota bacterium]